MRGEGVARDARDFVLALVEEHGDQVLLEDVREDKYGEGWLLGYSW